MAWPPPPQKNDWVNGDQQIDLHPDAHNDVANTLASDFVPQVDANRTGLAALSAVYGPTGIITATNPEVWSAGPFTKRDAAGAVDRGDIPSVNSNGYRYNTTNPADLTITAVGGVQVLPVDVVIDTSNTPNDVLFLVTASAWSLFDNLSTFYVNVVWDTQFGTPARVSAELAYQGIGGLTAASTAGAKRENVMTHTWPVVVPGIEDGVIFRATGTAVTNDVLITESTLTVARFNL